jgi:formate dehydrogenase major subunit
MVQDYFMTDTAQHANLVLPASMPFEIGGSFANTQKAIQQFDAVLPSKVGRTSIQQLSALLGRFDLNGYKNSRNVLDEIISILPETTSDKTLKFQFTTDHNCNRMFSYGCDAVVKRFEEHFASQINQ